MSRAKCLELDGVAITEHDYLWSKDEVTHLKQISGCEGLVILRGKEVAIDGLHVILFNYFEDVPNAESVGEILGKIRSVGGISVLSHPFRYDRHLNDSWEELRHLVEPFDAMETLTPNHIQKAMNLASDLSKVCYMPAVGGSDSHSPSQVGTFVTVFDDEIRDESQLVQAIKKGRCRPRAYSP